LFAGDLNSGEKLNLARNVFKRRVLWQLGDKIDDELSIAHGRDDRPEGTRRQIKNRLARMPESPVCKQIAEKKLSFMAEKSGVFLEILDELASCFFGYEDGDIHCQYYSKLLRCLF
jgi:hypothetical protein